MYLGYTDLMLNELSSCFNPHTLQTLRGLCLLKCPSKAFQNMANSRSLNLFVLNNDGGGWTETVHEQLYQLCEFNLSLSFYYIPPRAFMDAASNL